QAKPECRIAHVTTLEPNWPAQNSARFRFGLADADAWGEPAHDLHPAAARAIRSVNGDDLIDGKPHGDRHVDLRAAKACGGDANDRELAVAAAQPGSDCAGVSSELTPPVIVADHRDGIGSCL